MDKYKFRSSGVWKRKRAEILERDHNTCKICSCKKDLQVHHIYSLDTNPELRLENNNLITLCSQCHHNVHNGVFSQYFLIKQIKDAR